MAITATTLSAAITSTQISFAVASATGITAPNFQTGTGITYLLIDEELMQVTGVSGTVVSVVRGFNSTLAQAHASGANVSIGLPTDFPASNITVGSQTTGALTYGTLNQPAVVLSGSADALTGASGVFIIKTAGVDAITLPTATAAMETNVIEVWSDTTNAHTITAASACIATGIALKTVLTFTAFRGCGVKLVARNLTWHLIGGSGVATAANGGVVPS